MRIAILFGISGLIALSACGGQSVEELVRERFERRVPKEPATSLSPSATWADEVPPSVIEVRPSGSDEPLRLVDGIHLRFSEPVDGVSPVTGQLTVNDAPVPSQVQMHADGRGANFYPLNPYPPGARVNLRIEAFDRAGNPLEGEAAWAFSVQDCSGTPKGWEPITCEVTWTMLDRPETSQIFENVDGSTVLVTWTTAHDETLAASIANIRVRDQEGWRLIGSRACTNVVRTRTGVRLIRAADVYHPEANTIGITRIVGDRLEDLELPALPGLGGAGWDDHWGAVAWSSSSSTGIQVWAFQPTGWEMLGRPFRQSWDWPSPPAGDGAGNLLFTTSTPTTLDVHLFNGFDWVDVHAPGPVVGFGPDGTLFAHDDTAVYALAPSQLEWKTSPPPALRETGSIWWAGITDAGDIAIHALHHDGTNHVHMQTATGWQDLGTASIDVDRATTSKGVSMLRRDGAQLSYRVFRPQP